MALNIRKATKDDIGMLWLPFESNKGSQVFFLPEEEAAIDRLHSVRQLVTV